MEDTMTKEVQVTSHDDLLEKIDGKERAYVLIYKAGSELSECALNAIRKAMEDDPGMNLYLVDVSQVRDVHAVYGITTAPTLLAFEKGEYRNAFKGCNDPGYYKSVFENLITATLPAGEGKPRKRVVVYSTPSCPWCNTLKSYLRTTTSRSAMWMCHVTSGPPKNWCAARDNRAYPRRRSTASGWSVLIRKK